jgi:hypothetical protein
MAKSKRPQQQPKRIGQSQPEGVSRAQAMKNSANPTPKSAGAAVATSPRADTAKTTAPASAAKSSANGSNGSSSVNGTSKLNAIRASTATTATKPGGGGIQGRRPPQKRYARPPWWRRNLGPLITIGLVVIVIGGFIGFALYQNSQAQAGIGDPVPASIMRTLTTIPDSSFETVGKGTTIIMSTTNATPANTPVLTSGGKPEVVYVGAEYCPYCAADRWGTIIALSRFGTFKGITLMRSSGTDSYPNTATFSFRNATYTSQYITFSMTETADRSGNALATPSSDVMSVFTQYDTAPYTKSAGSIPFLTYGNQYISVGSPFFPTMMQGLNWNQMARQLQDPKSDVSQAVISSANYQTAMICKLTNNKPGNVCNTSIIQQLESTLPKAS